MRTSNKILLTAFLTVIVLIAVVPVVILAKYKSGDIVVVDKQQISSRFERHSLENVRYISIVGLERCNIMPSDTAFMEIERADQQWVTFHRAGDTLLIKGDSVWKRGNETLRIRGNQLVKLYLPGAENISLDFCHVYLFGSLDSARAASYNIDAFGSTVEVGLNAGRSNSFIYFDEVKIKAYQQSTLLTKVNTGINDLQLDLTESSFSDHGSMMNAFKLRTDEQSTITLKKGSIKKLQFIPNP